MRASAAITFRVDDAERRELVARAEREKVSLSDYIRVRLGLRGLGSESDDEVQNDGQYEALREQVADHERRLHDLEDDHARGRPGTS
jgi:Mobilization protein NikA